MRFLLDVHIGAGIARALMEREYDVVRAGFGYHDWSDAALLALAVSERRIVVTQDSDFSDLVYARQAPAPPAILYLRCDPEDQCEMTDRLLAVLDSGHLQGHMVVIRPDNIRYRPLPEMSKDNG